MRKKCGKNILMLIQIQVSFSSFNKQKSFLKFPGGSTERLNTIVKSILLRRTKNQICAETNKPIVRKNLFLNHNPVSYTLKPNPFSPNNRIKKLFANGWVRTHDLISITPIFLYLNPIQLGHKN